MKYDKTEPCKLKTNLRNVYLIISNFWTVIDLLVAIIHNWQNCIIAIGFIFKSSFDLICICTRVWVLLIAVFVVVIWRSDIGGCSVSTCRGCDYRSETGDAYVISLQSVSHEPVKNQISWKITVIGKYVIPAHVALASHLLNWSIRHWFSGNKLSNHKMHYMDFMDTYLLNIKKIIKIFEFSWPKAHLQYQNNVSVHEMSKFYILLLWTFATKHKIVLRFCLYYPKLRLLIYSSIKKLN